MVGTLRGADSTGMFQVDRNNSVEVCKYPYSGEIFLDKRRPARMFNLADTNLITVLHHRAATIGNVKQDNCHPFEHEEEGKYLVGVHNGHISNHRGREDNIEFAVDSDWGMYQLLKHGPEKGVGKLEGPMVLAWWENDGLFRLYGNSKRTIYWAFVKGLNAMVGSSEAGMLWWLASRNGIELESKPFYPAENTIYTFNPDDLRAVKTSKVIREEKKSQVIPVQQPSLGINDEWDRRRRAIQAQHGSGNHNNVVNLFPQNKDKDAILNGRTWQTHPVYCTPKSVRDNYKIDLGTVVEFVPDENLRGMCSQINTMIGEALINDSEGVVDTPFAIVDSCTPSVKVNVWKATKARGEVKCRVIGISKVTIQAKDYSCLVLAKPHSVSGNNLENEDGDDWMADMVKGPSGVYIPKSEYTKLCKAGCSWCLEAIQVSDSEDITWWDGSNGALEPVCRDCSNKMKESEALQAKLLADAAREHPPTGSQ